MAQDRSHLSAVAQVGLLIDSRRHHQPHDGGFSSLRSPVYFHWYGRFSDILRLSLFGIYVQVPYVRFRRDIKINSGATENEIPPPTLTLLHPAPGRNYFSEAILFFSDCKKIVCKIWMGNVREKYLKQKLFH